jgi:hypothetical protein
MAQCASVIAPYALRAMAKPIQRAARSCLCAASLKHVQARRRTLAVSRRGGSMEHAESEKVPLLCNILLAVDARPGGTRMKA